MRFWIAAVFSFAAVAQTKWTVEDILMAERADTVVVSRDGKWVAWLKAQIDREKGESVSNLYLKNLAEDYTVQITRGTDSHVSPKFSPDGKRIAWLSARRDSAAPAPAPGGGVPSGPTGMQVWMADLRGGEPYSVTKFEKGVRTFDWIDNDNLLLVSPEDASLHEQRVKERKDTSQVVEDEQHEPPVRLFRFALKGRTTARLTDNMDRVRNVAVSSDGKWAVTVHERSLRYTWDQNVRPVTFLHDLASGVATQLFADGKLMPGQIDWTPDSKGFYFSAPYTTHPKYTSAAISLLYYFDLATKKESKVDLDWENGLSGGFELRPDGFAATLANGMRPRAAVYRREGERFVRTWVESEHNPHIFTMRFSDDGKTVVYRHTNASKPVQWFVAQADGAKFTSPKPLTELNAGWKKRTFAKTELMTWKGARDEQVEGLLYYPHNYEAGKKYPLVVMIHGGPHGADFDAFSDGWAYPHNLMAQRGAFVMKPNYHGSSQYGLKFGESISGGNYNELEWIDVEKGVDSLIAKGLVDADKLGVMGWSNGSIISIELTTRTTRYKVAGAGAGDVNWISDWGNCAFGDSFEQYYLGKTPLQDPQLYIKKSPLFRMDKVRTPTIIFFGTEDRQVPTEQGWQHYRALSSLGNTDVRFILFPGEGHGPRKFVHQRRKLEEELAWFDKYLFKTLPDVNEALKPESPLSAALKLRKMSSPETVMRGEVEIGRFEITRAQFAQFDASYKFAPGTENYPASGVTFEQAKGYAEWLSKQTSRKYRLPKEEELESMARASKSENTLDAWAGYSVNADDAKKLASMIEGLGAGALLKPVGSFAGSGEDPIFDLGGNAAEWVATKDGTGKVIGGSADRPVDAKAKTAARTDYVGFRVVREP